MQNLTLLFLSLFLIAISGQPLAARGSWTTEITGTEIQGDSVKVRYRQTATEEMTASVMLQFTLDEGRTFVRAMAVSGDLTGEHSAVEKLIDWKFREDTRTNAPNIRLRIVPMGETQVSAAKLSAPFVLQNNRPPTISLFQVEGNHSGYLHCIFHAVDPDGDTLRVKVERLQKDGTWAPAACPDLKQKIRLTRNMSADFYWDTWRDQVENGPVQLKLTVSDGNDHTVSRETEPYMLDNSRFPRASHVQVSGKGPIKDVTYDLHWDRQESVAVWLCYSVDQGKHFNLSAELNNAVLPGSERHIQFDTHKYFYQAHDGVVLRIQPLYGGFPGLGGPAFSKPFAIPVREEYQYPSRITSLTAAGNQGAIELEFTLEGESGIYYETEVEYSLDGGKNWQQTANLQVLSPDRTIETLFWPMNEMPSQDEVHRQVSNRSRFAEFRAGTHRLIWQSARDFQDKAKVSLRIRSFLRLLKGNWQEVQVGPLCSCKPLQINNSLFKNPLSIDQMVANDTEIDVRYQVNLPYPWKLNVSYGPQDGPLQPLTSDRIQGALRGDKKEIKEIRISVPRVDCPGFTLGFQLEITDGKGTVSELHPQRFPLPGYNPRRKNPLLENAMIFMQAGLYDRVSQCLVQAMKLDWADPQIEVIKAEYSFRTGDFRGAEELYLSAVNREPDNEDFAIGLAWAMIGNAENNMETRRVIPELQRVCETWSTRSTDPEGWLPVRATLLRYMNKRSEAVELMSGASGKGPESVTLLLEWGSGLVFQQQYLRSAQTLEKVIRLRGWNHWQSGRDALLTWIAWRLGGDRVSARRFAEEAANQFPPGRWPRDGFQYLLHPESGSDEPPPGLTAKQLTEFNLMRVVLQLEAADSSGVGPLLEQIARATGDQDDWLAGVCGVVTESLASKGSGSGGSQNFGTGGF